MTAPASTDDIKVLQHFLDLTNQYLAKLQRLTGDDEVTDASVKSFAETVAGLAIDAVRRWPS